MKGTVAFSSAQTALNELNCLCVCCCCSRYLISQGANVGVVNSEGETPLDIAEEEAMEELLKNEINRQGAVSHW